MKLFSKSETFVLVIIFTVLVAISIPNFVLSLARARDQTRRDDLGTLVYALNEYLNDFGTFPQSSSDGRIIGCLKPGDKPVKDKLGRWIYTSVPCDWGKDSFVNPISGKTYISLLPQDPAYKIGLKYLYFSEGEKYQLYEWMEDSSEAEVDQKIIALHLACGTKICNVGRSYNVPIDMSIEDYDKTLLPKK